MQIYLQWLKVPEKHGVQFGNQVVNVLILNGLMMSV